MARRRHLPEIQALIKRLRAASAGECAAATAYAGHWRSVQDATQRRRIREIQKEEIAHRLRVQEMLRELGTNHSRLRDAIFWCIGFAIALSCFIGGWLIPMVGAGRIEKRNILEYEDAARKAVMAGWPEWADEFLAMAEVEWDHEKTFHDWVRTHPCSQGRFAGRIDWPNPPTRGEIRANFLRDMKRSNPSAHVPVEIHSPVTVPLIMER